MINKLMYLEYKHTFSHKTIEKWICLLLNGMKVCPCLFSGISPGDELCPERQDVREWYEELEDKDEDVTQTAISHDYCTIMCIRADIYFNIEDKKELGRRLKELLL